MSNTTMSNSNQIDWNAVEKKEARGLNDFNLGEVQDVKTCYVHTKKGTIMQTHYYVPRSRATRYDGDKLYFDVSEADAIEFKGLKKPSEDDCEMKYEAQVTDQPNLKDRPLAFPETTETRDLSNIVERIPLMTERLDVNKHTIREEAIIRKVPYMEKQTKDIPVTREILTIERVTPSEDKLVTNVKDKENWTASDTMRTKDTQYTTGARGTTDDLSPKEIKITLEHEAVDVTKTPYVKEELIVRKKPVTETVHVTEDIRSEKFETSDNINNPESDTMSEEERKKITTTEESKTLRDI